MYTVRGRDSGLGDRFSSPFGTRLTERDLDLDLDFDRPNPSAFLAKVSAYKKLSSYVNTKNGVL